MKYARVIALSLLLASGQIPALAQNNRVREGVSEKDFQRFLSTLEPGEYGVVLDREGRELFHVYPPQDEPEKPKGRRWYQKKKFWVLTAGVAGFFALIAYAVREKYRVVLPARPAPALPALTARAKSWQHPEAVSQEPMQCAAETIRQALRSEPWRVADLPDTATIYRGCQRYDGLADGRLSGTKPRACAEYARQQKLVADWYDLKTLAEVLSYLQHKGPVPVGARHPFEFAVSQASGFPPQLPTLETEPGGHVYLVVAFDLDEPCHSGPLDEPNGKFGAVTYLDHKGTGWGLNGRGKICMDDFARIMADSKTEAVGIVR